MRDNLDTQRMAGCDPDDPPSRLLLVRDIAAMLNSGGGWILLGVDAGGREVGVPAAHAAQMDAAGLNDCLATFVRPDRIELQVAARPVGEGRTLVEIAVPVVNEPPIVLSRAGEYAGPGGRSVTVFPARSVYVRRNGRAELARREDYRRWRDEAVEQARDEIAQRLTMVVEAPPGSRIRIVTESEVLDEPRFLLSRSSDVFRQRPEHLLTGDALGYLWLHRDVLELDATARELIVQSALRRRATLYLWLGELRPRRNEVKDYLQRALSMKDRDKSDAARSILLVAAMFLDGDAYRELHRALAASSYAHMREAAEALPDPGAARAQLAVEGTSSVDGSPLQELPAARLVAVADELLDGSLVRASRRVPPIGLELLRRAMPYPDGPNEGW